MFVNIADFSCMIFGPRKPQLMYYSRALLGDKNQAISNNIKISKKGVIYCLYLSIVLTASCFKFI